MLIDIIADIGADKKPHWNKTHPESQHMGKHYY